MGCLKSRRCVCAAFVIVVISIIITAYFLTHKLRTSDKCYDNTAVATDGSICSQIGSDILKRNGSAVDAAIASLLCLGLYNSHSTGIGGGVIFTIYNAQTGKVETINARETAPAGASENMFGPDPEKADPGLFIAVPGELRGYEMAHRRHGRLPWKELFQPSIKLAEEGFKIGRALAKAINDTVQKNSVLCEVFCDSNKNNLKENDAIKFPKLADTYKKIAEGGADVFYDGSLTQGALDDIRAAGGKITREDLKGYKAVLNEYALNFTVGNYIFLAPDAPFGGPVLALIFNVLKGYNLSISSMSTVENKTLTFHRMIETFRFADVQKSELGDPLHEDISEFIKKMTSDSFADRIRSKIKDDVKQSSYSEGDDVNFVHDEHGTSHLSIIAEDGSAVAVTSSINNNFGSRVLSRSTGIIFNDHMWDFIDPELISGTNKRNLIKPGKRPLSSMCPTIILDKDSKQVKMVVGSEGGTNITTAVAQVILNHLFFGYGLKRAVAEPRLQIVLNETNVEENFDTGVIAGLKQKNHHIHHNTALTVVQAVVQQGGRICAASDSRKGGEPAGY